MSLMKVMNCYYKCNVMVKSHFITMSWVLTILYFFTNCWLIFIFYKNYLKKILFTLQCFLCLLNIEYFYMSQALRKEMIFLGVCVEAK